MDKYISDLQVGISLVFGILTYYFRSEVDIAISVMLLTAVLFVSWNLGIPQTFFPKFYAQVMAWYQSILLKRKESRKLERYDILVGFDPKTRRAIYKNLSVTGHWSVVGTTRFGKTTFLHSLIHWIINNESPRNIKILISDPKTVDYSIYTNLAFMPIPIARDGAETEELLDYATEIMERRINLFSAWSESFVCNNIDRYADITERETGKRHELPRLIVILDELADVIDYGEVKPKLIRLSKLGAAYGITLICATQRPSVRVIPGELRSQLATKIVGYLPDSTEYGVVAKVPKELYENMSAIPGRFMCRFVGVWSFVQGRYVEDDELESSAAKYASRKKTWERYFDIHGKQDTEGDVAPEKEDDFPDELPRRWNTKGPMLEAWAHSFDEIPTLDEIKKRWKCTTKTARVYLEYIEKKVGK